MIHSKSKKLHSAYINRNLFSPLSFLCCSNFFFIHFATSTFAYPQPFTSNKYHHTYRTVSTSLNSISNNIDSSFALPKAIIQNSEKSQQKNTMKAWRCHGRNNRELIDHLIMVRFTFIYFNFWIYLCQDSFCIPKQ